jgi:hypothetical protein
MFGFGRCSIMPWKINKVGAAKVISVGNSKGEKYLRLKMNKRHSKMYLDGMVKSWIY